MKIRNLFLLFVLLAAFSISGFAQVEEEESQVFGTTRTLAKPGINVHDFGMIKNKVLTHKFEITNKGNTPMEIAKFNIPEGFGVILIDKVIEKKSKGAFIITVNPDYIKGKGEIKQEFMVTTKQMTPTGEKITKEITYLLKAKK